MNQPDDIMDLRGIPCPKNAAMALMRLAGMDEGQKLEILLDDGEPMTNVSASLEGEGYRIISKSPCDGGSWRLVAQVGGEM